MRLFKAMPAALGLIALATVAPATAAQAAPASQDGGVSITAYADCPSGWFCVWEHAGGQGRMARFQSGAPNLGAFNLNDQVSSAWNRTGVVWCTYIDINYTGGKWPVGNWQGNTGDYSRNDNISSLRRGAC
ncbi:peptidase inhibitor family I36 protein [Amycolatopsis lurida]|uniref:peptidase inhibitor family I36 protein n=1 Tax=Amycolatopsis lurida TaxID=31959 RepID=UPI00364ED8F3